MLIVTAPKGVNGAAGGQPQPSRAKGVLDLEALEFEGVRAAVSVGAL
jgi:hypothetical protein